ncbi:MAG: hypothetical protein P8J45_08475 [Phycisphaerales bacterium]|nr:hypothetical protein [Phycisphaerales bacterium]
MRLQDHLPSGVRIPGMFIVSALAILIISAFMISNMSTLFSAAMEPSVESEDADVVSRLLANNRVLDKSESRFTGRSMFYIPRAPRMPAPPPPPRRDPPPVREPEPTPPVVARIPTTYGGPKMTGVLGADVFFDNGKRIPEGENADGIEVLTIRSPFDVQVKWQGGEFELSLFTEELPDYFNEAPFADGNASNLLSLEMAPAPGSMTPQSSSRRSEQPRPPQSNRSGSDEPTEIPAPLTDEALEEMSRMDAIRALTKINSVLRASDVPDSEKGRLRDDRKRLETRIRSSAGGN